MVFHHKGDKDYSFNKIKSHRWSKLKKEILKCTLLCSNCHRELHFNEKEPVDRKSRENKTILLKYIGKMKCEICGYDKCNGSLDFHHKDNKEHNISDLIGKQKYNVEKLKKKFVSN